MLENIVEQMVMGGNYDPVGVTVAVITVTSAPTDPITHSDVIGLRKGGGVDVVAAP